MLAIGRFVCPLKLASSVPDSASHTRTVISQEAVTTRRPSGLNSADRISLVCPLKLASSVPVAASLHTHWFRTESDRHHTPAIGTKRCRSHRILVSREGTHFGSGRGIRHPYRFVRESNDNPSAVGAECRHQRISGVSLEDGGDGFDFTGRIPHSHRVVHRRGKYPSSIGAERGRFQPLCVPLEDREFASRDWI